MSRPKVKQIKNLDDAMNDDEQVYFYLQYSDDMTQITLGLTCKDAMTPEEYIQCLSDFVNEVSEHPQNLFVESVNHDDDVGLH